MALQDLSQLKVGFIGGGNMASAIGSALIKKGIIKADNIWVSGKTDRTFSSWNNLGAHTTLSNGKVVEKCDVIFLATKPQMLDNALQDLKDTLTIRESRKLFISVLAGVTLHVLSEKLRSILHEVDVIRAIPNTPMMIGEGITVFCLHHQNNAHEELAHALFSPVGMSEVVPESLMNAIGALSGSGPAYAYLITEALADGAVRMGVPRAMATKFAAQILIGSGKMVLETGRHPGQLKDEVCSPGGTTITGIHALERGSVRGSIMSAIEAAANRSDELTSAHEK